MAVVRGGEVVHLAGYGVADDTGRTVTPDTPFILGSASKPFTGVVIGQLVEEGLLSWDEPVWPHLSHLVDEPPAHPMDEGIQADIARGGAPAHVDDAEVHREPPR